MGIDKVTSDYFVSSNATVVGPRSKLMLSKQLRKPENLPLWAWETVGRPSEWASVHIKESVLLFNAEPGFFSSALLGGFVSCLAMVSLQRSLIVFVGLAPWKGRWKLGISM